MWKHRINVRLFGNNRKLLQELYNNRPNTGSELRRAASLKYGGIEYEVRQSCIKRHSVKKILFYNVGLYHVIGLVVGNLGLSNCINHTIKKTNIQGLNRGTLPINMHLCTSKYQYIKHRLPLPDDGSCVIRNMLQ